MLKRYATQLRRALAAMKPGDSVLLRGDWIGFRLEGFESAPSVNVTNAVRHQLKRACPCTYKDFTLTNEPDGVRVYRDVDGCYDLLRSK